LQSVEQTGQNHVLLPIQSVLGSAVFRVFGEGGGSHWSGFFRFQAKFTFALTAHGTPPKTKEIPTISTADW
jgi:hypothetical protein